MANVKRFHVRISLKDESKRELYTQEYSIKLEYVRSSKGAHLENMAGLSAKRFWEAVVMMGLLDDEKPEGDNLPVKRGGK